eukprot:GHUV01005376.1.p1 GENE.GHUV01005376.1~~GHUV01005376.1.p1  ORF type:complete len:403 (+),score=86.02 GHUV01005376.1:282-1490(+)
MQAVQNTVQDAKEAAMGAGAQLKETVTGRPTLAPSEDFNTATLTTNTGAPIDDVEHSMTIGPRGPVVLEDVPLVEKLGQLDREKIPERVVHARGMVAKGYFKVTHDVSDICKADFLSSVGKKTPVAARFSTVVHPAGSPESLRDVRGFSVKMYTQEGNWDFVGNSIPVFFIRDGMQFPDLVHCLRPNPKNNIQESWRILDFLSFHPESVNILTYLLDNPGVFANWRSMEGHSVNTYTMINSEGKEVYVKFIWTPQGGPKYLSDEEVTQVGDLNWRQSHATHDLYSAIERKEYPEWELSVQVLSITSVTLLPVYVLFLFVLYIVPTSEQHSRCDLCSLCEQELKSAQLSASSWTATASYCSCLLSIIICYDSKLVYLKQYSPMVSIFRLVTHLYPLMPELILR